MKRTILNLSLIIGLTGCISAPKTSLQFNPRTGALSLQSPKNVAIQEASVTTGSNGIYTLTLKGYSSTNDSAIVSAVAQANAMQAKALSDAAIQALGTAIQASR